MLDLWVIRLGVAFNAVASFVGYSFVCGIRCSAGFVGYSFVVARGREMALLMCKHYLDKNGKGSVAKRSEA